MNHREIVEHPADCPFFNDDRWACQLVEIGAADCNVNYGGQIPPDCPLRQGPVVVCLKE